MAKLTSKYVLPVPEKDGDEYIYKPIVRLGNSVPFGYRQDPDDKDVLLPVPEELELLEYGKKHLKQYSYRAVAQWLSEESGRYISHVGLYKRLKRERKNKRQATDYQNLAKLAEEAAKKAKFYEQKPGYRVKRIFPEDDPEGDS